MEDLVNFELAKKLKENGFRELCLAYYTNDDTLYYNYSHKYGACYRDCYLSHNLMPKDSVSGKFIDAPTISQVLKWLREGKELHTEIYMYNNCYLWEIYNTEIYDADFTQKSEKYSEIEYGTYEQAALAGIEYVLDNLI